MYISLNADLENHSVFKSTVMKEVCIKCLRTSAWGKASKELRVEEAVTTSLSAS